MRTRLIPIALFAATAAFALGQPARSGGGLGVEKGFENFRSPDYQVRLVPEAGVAVGLVPVGGKGFDFLPFDWLARRQANGFVHLGDLSLRVREAGAGPWRNLDTFRSRKPVRRIASSHEGIEDDLSAALGPDLEVRRTWTTVGGRLQLRFRLRNRAKRPLEIGGLGFAMPFNNIIMERSLEEAHAKCSFTDPYIGGDAGFLRVTRLDGVGPTMVVTPAGDTPFEAWHLVPEPIRPNQVFEGMMEWMVHTSAFAENEWKGVEPWVQPSSATLAPGEFRTYGFQFTPSPSIRAIEDTVASAGRPVAIGIPGYVLPRDQTGKLFLRYPKPVRKAEVSPEGALAVTPNREGRRGWRGYDLRVTRFGRIRLTVTYSDGVEQVISLYGTEPSVEAVSDLGRFLTTKAWFDDRDDPFGRAPSAISYDREADAQVRQDPRVWIAGLGDEGGSGNWLALAMKNFGQPDPAEVAKLESFVDGVLWGNLQFSDGPNRYGVRKSVFFYDPKALPQFPYDARFNWTSWTSWSKRATDDIGRAYNYPHVVAAYWALYRVARNHPYLTTKHDWRWYLEQAYRTTEFLTSQTEGGRDRVGYMRLGLMDGTVFINLLDDLRREGWTEAADRIESRMKMRAERWKAEAFPFGSEMAWDSTGQEEVYGWCKFFGYEDKAQVTLNSILAYDPTVPHWGYNGNARRYWDFLYGGKLSRIERQIHHYGSGLNAIPILTEFRQHPDDLYLLRVGYGGTMGALSNIDEGGFASAAFHSFPSTLRWDAYSGDYGPNFFGHAQNVGAYVVRTEEFGWQGFGAEVRREGRAVEVRPQDSFRKRVFLAPIGLYLTLDSGRFDSVRFDPGTGRVTVRLDPRDEITRTARLRVQTPTPGKAKYQPIKVLPFVADAFEIPLGSEVTSVLLRPAN
jgi:hypothetical protein